MNAMSRIVCLGLLACGFGAMPASGGIDPLAPSVQGVADRVRAAAPTVLRHEIGERGPNHRQWLKVEQVVSPDGQLEVVTNVAYVELATGMHYHENGQWRESKEEFSVVPGWAVARKGPHKVSLAYNLNTAGPVVVQLPDGRTMRSQVLSLHYIDSTTGRSVRLAEIKDCVGTVLPPNRVLYADAFAGIKADVRFTYTKAGIEQDVILREQPPRAEDRGLNPSTTKLAVLTEFIDPPAATIKKTGSARTASAANVEDEDVDFGPMRLGRGKAFAQSTNSISRLGRKDAAVGKRWMHANGRHFLLEQVSLPDVREELEKLPRQAGLSPRTSRTFHAGIDFPEPRLAEPSSEKPLEIAQVVRESPGYVLDYLQLNGSLTNFTFRSDTTYYVSERVNLLGNTTFEGGTVIKFAPITYSDGFLYIEGGTVNCKTGPYRPVVMTSRDDDSVGAIISGSSGTPAINHLDSYYLGIWGITNLDLRHFRISYGYCPVTVMESSGVLSDFQLCHNDYPFWFLYSALSVRNLLIQDVPQVALWLDNSTVSAEHLTVHQCAMLGYDGWSSAMALTNSLVGAQSLGSVPLATNAVVYFGTNSGIFQTVGAGSHYLAAGSPYRNAGTTNIHATLRAGLARKTTHPPVLLTNVTVSTATVLTPQAVRDSDTPDLGYHYDPLDYLVHYAQFTNAPLTISNGVAIGAYLDNPGIWLQDGSSITAVGTPDQPIQFTFYNTVQEQSLFLSSLARSNFNYGCIVYPYHTGPTIPYGPQGTFRFAKFSAMANSGVPFYHAGAQHDFSQLLVQDCEIGMMHGFGEIRSYTNTTTRFLNNLFHRTRLQFMGWIGSQVLVSNNLFVGSTNLAFRGGFSGNLQIHNNAFDSSHLVSMPGFSGAVLSNNHNAYLNCTGAVPLTNAGPNNIILTNALAWQTGPLGDFYQPAGSPLIDMGSQPAYLSGLHHYTTQTNQVRELGSVVDIGYHYVALNTGGAPFDTDGDGTPDYADADSDNDGVDDVSEFALGRNPLAAGAVADTGGVTGLVRYTPLK